MLPPHRKWGGLDVVANGDADNPMRLGQGLPIISIE
jgi:hypothetical protein